ncbi:MAG: ParB/RepB/Spo0J family partition protein [Clostridia bacterium]|nr:ParB/RepB/Spo0J family partition protein [Clostridia bacterium]
MKKGLGKGLEALFESATEEEKRTVTEVDINLINRDVNQPRKLFNEEELNNLAQSIASNGIIQPLIVRKVDNGYTIIAGERRWRAAKKLKLKVVPIVVREVTDKQILEFALIENIQRKDLNAIEEAKAFKRLQDEYNMTQEEISLSVGKSRVAITNKLRLLNLDSTLQEFIEKEQLSEGHGRALLGIEDKKLRLEVAVKAIENGLNVREIEKIANAAPKKKKEKQPVLNEEEYAYVENVLAKKLGTRVKITRSSKKGKIVIEYFSLEGLNRIIDIIKK